MKLFVLLVASSLLAVGLVGCRDKITNITDNYYEIPDSTGNHENPPDQRVTDDLRVRAWDRRVDGAAEGVRIVVIETGDGDVTGDDGWTRRLDTPANAQWIQIVVDWRDRAGFGHSYQTGVRMSHQIVTETTVYVDTTPPR